MNTTHALATVTLCTSLLSGMAGAQERTAAREVGRTTEKELNIVLSTSFGSLMVSRGDPEKMLVIEAEQTGKPLQTFVDYSVKNRIGYADISLGDERKDDERKRGSFNLKDFHKGKWFLKVSDAVPVSFDVELGVGSGDFNLSGMQIKNFTLSAGASDVTLAFDEPNKTRVENITIESGVSKFDGRNLGNANFRRFRFQGGVGSYTLDFGGMLKNEVDVDVEIGFGVLTIYVPRDVGARVVYDKSWMSRIDCDEDFVESATNEYQTNNYHEATGKMNVRIDSGLGSIKIRRR
jgi:hypothetical protein